MLRTYPEALLHYAVDGVVQAACIGHADDMARLHGFARRRARQAYEQAVADADDLREQAALDGYRDGLLQAMKSLLPLLESLQQKQHVLVQAMQDQMQQRLQAMTSAPEVLVPQLVEACEHWARPAATDSLAVLHVPATHTALLQALREEPALAAIEIRPAQRKQPLLEVGATAYVLDLETPLAEAAEIALQHQFPSLQPALADLAAAYCQRLQMDLTTTAQRERFSHFKANNFKANT